MRILVTTDAWHPQVKGVVRTLTKLADAAKSLDVEFSFLTPQSFRTFAMTSYRDVRLAMPRPGRIAKLIEEARPDSMHRDGGADRPDGPALLPPAQAALHDQLPHPLSRICPRPRAGAGLADLAGRCADSIAPAAP